MKSLLDMLATAPPRPIFSSDVGAETYARETGRAPRTSTVPPFDRDVVHTYAFFHGLAGLELEARSFRHARPAATRSAFARHLADQMGRA